MKRGLSILMCVLLTSLMSMADTHEYVDLGLPSGTLWATYNVGASTPEDYGSYFAWGETTTKSTYSWSNYQYASGSASTAIYIGSFLPNNNKVTSIQGTQYDAAKAQWGNDWVMPSKDQVHELINKCSVSAKTINGVKGVQYKGPNGKTMFLPCGGYKADGNHNGVGTEGYYWSGTGDVYDLEKSKAVALYNKSSSLTTGKNIQRRTGACVRAVRASGSDPGTTTDPEDADPEAVDLGLSVKWATFNVGATSKEKTGTYFAWGETEKKSTYTWANYQHASGSSTTCKSIGADISETQYDAARKTWGDDWRMPTASEIDELMTKCTWTAETVNSVKGYTVKGPSGNSIFLPFAGCSYEGNTYGTGNYTYYWSSEVSDGETGAKAYALYPKSGTSTTKASIQRRTGAVIRPVKGAGSITPTPEEPEGFELVDLGLSVKWANMNLEATGLEKSGDYYAWGEKAKKSTYTWANYTYANGTQATAQNIGSDISGSTQYDAAYAWSESHSDEYPFTLCLPTAEQWSELVSKCTWTSATNNGVKGYTVKGPSGNSIFLPLSGCSYEGKNYTDNSYYWTSNNDASTAYKAQAARLTASAKSVTAIQRRTGAAIRAVEYIAPPLPPTPSGPTGPTVDVPADEVDLGLSVLWASYNLGATSMEGYGNYYAWGETETKSSFTWANYHHASGSSTTCKSIGADINETQYDAASEAWGDDWRMPTASEIDELRTKCTWTAATVNGVKGYTVKGPSGNTIFLPFAGCSYEGKDYGVGSYTYYWSSEVSEGATGAKAYALYPKSGTSTTKASIQRRTGAVIRPVKSDLTPPESILPPPAVYPELIDLGLSVKWSNQDVGSYCPGIFGDYIAWGETEPKSTYTWANYQHANGTQATAKNIGSDISGTQYDAAYVDDEQMCLPTTEQWNELINQCTFKLVDCPQWDSNLNDYVDGKAYEVTGPNGNSILLPLCGSSYEGKENGVGTNAYYWTANNDASTAYKAKAAYLTTTSKSVTSIQRRTGAAIRPVEKKSDDTSTTEAYAVLSVDKATLTFYYDAKKASRPGTKYALNQGDEQPGWSITSPKTVVFDSSFADARPTTCAYWFSFLGNELQTITNIKYLNTSEVTDMRYMFYACSNLAILDLSTFITSKVETMDCMFASCSKLKSMNLLWWDTSSLKNMKGMFANCSSLVTVYLPLVTNQVTNMSSLFLNCSSLSMIPLLNYINTSSVTTMSEMFKGCQALKELDLTSFDFRKVSSAMAMLAGCMANGIWVNATAELLPDDAFQGVFDNYSVTIDCSELHFPPGVSLNTKEAMAGAGSYPQIISYKGGYFSIGTPSIPSHECYDVIKGTSFIDLGLPSGSLWSEYNVGAMYAWIPGSHLAWSEEGIKKAYTWDNYKQTISSLKVYNFEYTNRMWNAEGGYDDEFETDANIVDDAGEMYYVGIPTKAEFQELIDNCDIQDYELFTNGWKLLKLTSKINGKAIYLPYAGSHYDSKTPNDGTVSYYWTSSSVDSKKAYAVMLDNGNATITSCQKRTGMTLRAIARYNGNYWDNHSNGGEFTVDGIKNVGTSPADDSPVYNLQGVKVEGVLKPGIYIKNGRKYVVK